MYNYAYSIKLYQKSDALDISFFHRLANEVLSNIVHEKIAQF